MADISSFLSEEDRNRWLIGWANDDGDTFSQFEHYDKFDKGTTEKNAQSHQTKSNRKIISFSEQEAPFHVKTY